MPFAGRVLALLLQFSGIILQSLDPRGELWTLGILPLTIFLCGWLVDLCLRQTGAARSAMARVAFSLFWLVLIGRTMGHEPTPIATWSCSWGMVGGIVAVGLPR